MQLDWTLQRSYLISRQRHEFEGGGLQRLAVGQRVGCESPDEFRRVGAGERGTVKVDLWPDDNSLFGLCHGVGEREAACPVACTDGLVKEVRSEDGVALDRITSTRQGGRSRQKLAGSQRHWLHNCKSQTTQAEINFSCQKYIQTPRMAQKNLSFCVIMVSHLVFCNSLEILIPTILLFIKQKF